MEYEIILANGDKFITCNIWPFLTAGSGFIKIGQTYINPAYIIKVAPAPVLYHEETNENGNS